MDALLLSRELGAIEPSLLRRYSTNRQIYALQRSLAVFDDGHGRPADGDRPQLPSSAVNALAVDAGEGRLLLSGSADGTLRLWDLAQASTPYPSPRLRPLSSLQGTPQVKIHTAGPSTSKGIAHTAGITYVSFYPFDPSAVVSAGYDHRLILHATDRLAAIVAFPLQSPIHAASLSPIAAHLLCATGTADPRVRLVDLKSGASTHSLAGHRGAVLAVAWSPAREWVLASGGVDGTVRLWDVRRSAPCLGLLAAGDTGGIAAPGAAAARGAVAHEGPVNGLAWTEDGRMLMSAGHDAELRVWDGLTGADELVTFGQAVRNAHVGNVTPVHVPRAVTAPGTRIVLWPNERELLMVDIVEGTVIKRLAVPGQSMGTTSGRQRRGPLKNRVTAAVYRGAGSVEVYSSHSDGSIVGWKPRMTEEAVIEDLGEVSGSFPSGHGDDGKRKADILDDVLEDITRKRQFASQ